MDFQRCRTHKVAQEMFVFQRESSLITLNLPSVRKDLYVFLCDKFKRKICVIVVEAEC